MMPIAARLAILLRSGVHRMGELEIQADVCHDRCVLCHWQDGECARAPDGGGLERYEGPGAARELSLYAANGAYRFAKGELNLKRGWVMVLSGMEELRQALDQFYPAGVGLFLAYQDGTLEIENLRDKLARQTGMYRFARTISDAGAQRLVREVCGPNHQCAKRILWQIAANTPLADSEASQFSGIPAGFPESEALPLLCREACNHFVAECRRVAKEEATA